MTPRALATSLSAAFSLVFALPFPTSAAPYWDVNLGGSFVNLGANTYADNGANLFRPVGIWDDDSPPNVTAFTSNFVIGPNTFDLGAALNPISRDQQLPLFVTSASAVGVITIHGLGTDTLDIRWRVNTLNDTIGGDGFLAQSSVILSALVFGLIEGVGPGTLVDITYDWEYFANAVPDYEAPFDDQVVAGGSLGFVDDQLSGPGNLFNVLFAEPGPFAGTSSGSNTYGLVTGNPTSYVLINLGGDAAANLASPGVGAAQEDLSGSEFIGRLTLRLSIPIPEPSCLCLALLACLKGIKGVRNRKMR